MCSLENIKLTQAEMNKLHVFQRKSFRRILGVPPTFIDRTQTNQVVREQVEQYGFDPTVFFSGVEKQNETTTMWTHDTCQPQGPTFSLGRPRLDWLQETIQFKMRFTPWEEFALSYAPRCSANWYGST